MRHATRLLQVSSILALFAALPACSLLVPENPSTPRYNSVLGPPRAPQLNPARGNSMAPRSEAPQPTAAQLAMQAEFPPVDAATDARAHEIMARDMAAPITAVESRPMPMENMPMAVAGNYPQLNSVPPAPTDNAQARLDAVRAQLEADRMGATAESMRLRSDAASEPSLLTPGVVPPPDPINVAPATPPVGIGPQSNYIALPPPPPPITQSAGTNWDRNIAPPMVTASVAAPAAQSGMEPIILRPPAGQPMASTPAQQPIFSAPTPAPAYATQTASASGFNPMEGADPIRLRPPGSSGGSNAYLPASRYSTRRY